MEREVRKYGRTIEVAQSSINRAAESVLTFTSTYVRFDSYVIVLTITIPKKL